MKICIKCKQEKPMEDFSIKRASKDGHNGKCKLCDKVDKQKYRDSNRENYRELARKHRAKNRDKINQQQNAGYQRNKDKRLKTERLKRISNPEVELYKGAKYRAKKKDLPFNITTDDIRIPKLCPVLGIPLSVGTGVLHEGSPTLDRFLPELGYTKENINVISSLANTIKSNATWEQVYSVAMWMKETEDN